MSLWNRTSAKNRLGFGSEYGAGTGSGQSVMCHCGTEPVQRTDQKDCPNEGRQFFACPKPRDSQCGLFECGLIMFHRLM